MSVIHTILSIHFQMEIKLYSTSRSVDQAFTGSPRQVCVSTKGKDDLLNKIAAGSVAAVVSPDLRGHADHIFAPKIHRDFDGDAKAIVGNASDTQGEYSLRSFDANDLKYFATVETNPTSDGRNCAPVELPTDVLEGTMWDGNKGKYVVLWPVVVALYFGNEVPYGSVIDEEGIETFRECGRGYGDWAMAAKVARDEQGAISHLVEKLGNMSPEYQKQYLYPPGGGWVISSLGSVATFGTARTAAYPAIATQLRAFFAPPASVPSGTGPGLQGAAAATALQSCTIQVRSSEDAEKDNAAKIGEAKCKLYLVGAEPDWKGGTIKNVL